MNNLHHLVGILTFRNKLILKYITRSHHCSIWKPLFGVIISALLFTTPGVGEFKLSDPHDPWMLCYNTLLTLVQMINEKKLRFVIKYGLCELLIYFWLNGFSYSSGIITNDGETLCDSSMAVGLYIKLHSRIDEMEEKKKKCIQQRIDKQMIAALQLNKYPPGMYLQFKKAMDAAQCITFGIGTAENCGWLLCDVKKHSVDFITKISTYTKLYKCSGCRLVYYCCRNLCIHNNVPNCIVNIFECLL
eukprot:424976_1